MTFNAKRVELTPTLPHWLRMALARMAELFRSEFDNETVFPCLKHPGDGCNRDEPWCINCERSAGIEAAATWINNGMPMPPPDHITY